MNSINASTGFSPFQLHIGRSPHIIPPLTNFSTPTDSPATEQWAREMIQQLQLDTLSAQDNLTTVKIN